jgi:hypothetical protein
MSKHTSNVYLCRFTPSTCAGSRVSTCTGLPLYLCRFTLSTCAGSLSLRLVSERSRDAIPKKKR